MHMSITRRNFIKTGIAAAVATPLLGLADGAPNVLPLSSPFSDGRQWWFQSRFGMFVHWGLYSIHGWHEQEQWRRRVPRAEYVKLQQQWNPVNFNPDHWLDLAEAAGMKYLTFTTKHHDGFCLWDTKQTDYNTMNTPYGKDVLKLLAEACHRRNFPLCLYYSVVDWHQPNYPNQGRSHELPPQPGDAPDRNKYLAFLKAQVRELCTNYGEIHGIWWDMNVPKYHDPSINAVIRELQPKAMINNRGFDAGDFGTPERDYDNSVNTKSRFQTPVEACQSVGYQSWGYRVDEDYFTTEYLIRSIQKVLAKGGNYLLNVGPQPDGVIPAESAAILRGIGPWFKVVKESLLEVESAAELTTNKNVALTRRGNTLYVHLLVEPEAPSVFLQPLTELPRRATLLNTGQTLECDVTDFPRLHGQTPDRCVRVKLPPVKECSTAGWVLKLEYEKFPVLGKTAAKREETK